MGIAIGNKVELVKLEQVIKNEKDKKIYVSKIYDIMSSNNLQIAMPIYEGKIVPLAIDEQYTACFYTDKGLLQCNVVVTSRYKSGNLFFLDILLLNDLNKVQRREFYRYSCLLDAKIREVSDYEFTTGRLDNVTIPEDELPWKSVKITDISGGGVKIVAKNHLDKNEVVKIKFYVYVIDEYVCFNLFAKVLDGASVQTVNGIYEYRLEFIKIRQEECDKIYRYIFESERINRAKETGR